MRLGLSTRVKSKLPEGFERDPQIRINRGYWDGVSARERGCQYPVWAKSWIARQSHPFDQKYGEGFWVGFYDEPAPRGAIVNPATEG